MFENIFDVLAHLVHHSPTGFETPEQRQNALDVVNAANPLTAERAAKAEQANKPDKENATDFDNAVAAQVKAQLEKLGIKLPEA